MSEMVLVTPLLLIVLMLMVFFGRGMVRAQRALVMDRYATWREVYAAPGPQWQLTNGTKSYNAAFYGSKAAEITREMDDEFPKDAEDELVSIIGEANPDAQDVVTEVFETLPGGLTTIFETTHTNTVALYARFDGPIIHRHTRAGNDWKFINSFEDLDGRDWENFNNDPMSHDWPPDDAVMGQWQAWPSHGTWWPGGQAAPVSILLALRESLYENLDSALEQMEDGGNQVAEELRKILIHEPGYGGPTADFNVDD